MNKSEFVTLYKRELGKLKNEVSKYGSDDDLWKTVPGTINPAGNIVQHLIGNLRTYVGDALGKVPYKRNRDAEFSERLFTQVSLMNEIDQLENIVLGAIEGLEGPDFSSEYPKEVLVMFPEQSVSIILMHLLIHLGYHMGQINYHRRFVAQKWSI